jgi:nitrile hydratase accessory protein
VSVDRRIANMDGDVAMPRKNGELVFQAPWEGHAFGLAVVLSDNGTYAWGDFRKGLVDAIERGQSDYYASWLSALESLLVARGIVTHREVDQRAAEYQALERDPVF